MASQKALFRELEILCEDGSIGYGEIAARWCKSRRLHILGVQTGEGARIFIAENVIPF